MRSLSSLWSSGLSCGGGFLDTANFPRGGRMKNKGLPVGDSPAIMQRVFATAHESQARFSFAEPEVSVFLGQTQVNPRDLHESQVFESYQPFPEARWLTDVDTHLGRFRRFRRSWCFSLAFAFQARGCGRASLKFVFLVAVDDSS